MLNMTQDEVFLTEDAHVFFDAIPGRRKRLMAWEGGHDDWPAEAIRNSVAFINEHTG
jgi:PhoPQ-activated pathogenicity-related protein